MLESFLDVKKMCQPAQAVVLLSVVAFVIEVIQTKGVFTVHNAFVLATLLMSHLSIGVLLDVFCRAGHKNFAWVLIILSGLLMVGADKALQKSLDGLTASDKTTDKKKPIPGPYSAY